MSTILDFEKPIIELENKIAELRTFSTEKEIDLTGEIDKLEQKAESLKNSVYGNMSPWQKVLIARHPERPTSLDLIKLIFEDFTELHGDRAYGDDLAVVGGLARFNGRPVTVIGHQKGKDTKDNIARNFGYAHPEGFRKALRLMEQAEKFGRPIFSFIDTPGAHPGVGAEERGQSEAIAYNLYRMSQLKVPFIATVIGEGGSGGALALGVGNRVFMLQHAVYSISTPETFSSILWKMSDRASEAAQVMKMTAKDLLELQVIDEIIEEPLGGAHKDPRQMAQIMKPYLEKALGELDQLSIEDLLEQRYAKFRGIGVVVSG